MTTITTLTVHGVTLERLGYGWTVEGYKILPDDGDGSWILTGGDRQPEGFLSPGSAVAALRAEGRLQPSVIVPRGEVERLVVEWERGIRQLDECHSSVHAYGAASKTAERRLGELLRKHALAHRYDLYGTRDES